MMEAGNMHYQQHCGQEAENKWWYNLESSGTAMGGCSDVFFYLSRTPRGPLSYKTLTEK